MSKGDTMKPIRCWAVGCAVAMLALVSVCGQSAEFDVAPFARRCCVEDRLTTQTEFNYTEAEHTPRMRRRLQTGIIFTACSGGRRVTFGKLSFALATVIHASQEFLNTGFVPGRIRRRICLRWKTRWMIPGRESG